MKIQKISLWLGLLLLIAMIAGCAQLAEKTGTPYYPTANIPKLEAITPILAPIVADTSTPTNTSTVIPTLPEEQAHAKLLDLLSDNGGCRLPCLWGITPGKNTVQEVSASWSLLSGITYERSYFFLDEGAIRPVYAEGDLMLHTEARYQSNNQIVSRIDFYAREEKRYVDPAKGFDWVYDSATFGKRVKYYSLAHLLSEQGIPGSVLIATLGFSKYHPVIFGGFEIILLYPEQGIWVRYTTQVQQFSVNGKIRGCPANAHIEMELFPPNNADVFSTSVEKFHPEILDEWHKPIEDVTSMTLKQFYETFRQPTDKCIDTPAKLWPTQESGGG